jgi:propanol-preferring alcohol dehydrogenase
MVLDAPGRPLRPAELPDPEPGPGQVLVRVHACGVCRTDLHILDGEVRGSRLPIVLGHQIVGTVEAAGEGAGHPSGARVGIPWLGWTCGVCRFCRSGRENLCLRARFTGLDIDGGYAERAVADGRFCFGLPEGFGDLEAAPLLCAGLIGFRTLRLAGDPERLGIYGFGAAAHIICQVAVAEGRRVFAFTRAGDEATQAFARELGAEWAGDALGPAPEELDAALIFAPAGELVPAALAAVAPGGTVVCGGIHMSDIPSFPYELLWHERVLRSVANLTRRDAEEFLALAPRVPVRTHVTTYGLADAGRALEDLRAGRLEGAAVLVP